MSNFTRKDFLGLGALVAGTVSAKELSALGISPNTSPAPPMRFL